MYFRYSVSVFGFRFVFFSFSVYFLVGSHKQSCSCRDIYNTRQWSPIPSGSVFVCSSVCQCRHLSKTERYYTLASYLFSHHCFANVKDEIVFAFLVQDLLHGSSSHRHTRILPKCVVLLMNPCFVSRSLLFFSFILSFHYLFRIGICIRSDAVNKRVSFNLNVIWFYFIARASYALCKYAAAAPVSIV